MTMSSASHVWGWSLGLGAVVGALVMLAPERAAACGGTFCDGGNPMPVDQTGEDILFIQDGDQIEVHVRIQYTGDVERFAWMVPLSAIPEVSVGSEPLFVELGRATIPVWTTIKSYENPADQPVPSTGLGFVPSDDTGDEGPQVVLEDVVGAFEVVVLSGGSAQEVLDFFTQNNYLFDDSAEPIIQQYIDEGFLITGVKLTAGAELEAIHPLVFRLTSDEPCVPIRLTAVAAKQDMGIRAYFLGQDRWVPSNYSHVVPNAVTYDWDAADYNTYIGMITRAVDEAGGHGFVTDYAGPSAAVDATDIYSPNWSAAGFEAMTAFEAMAALEQRNLLTQSNGFNIAPQMLALLRKYLPPPPDFPHGELEFWLAFFGYEEYYDKIPQWNGAAFAAELDEMVIVPGLHAADMLEAWPYLTRLHTTLSPHEMTLDPTFHSNADLPMQARARRADGLVYDGLTWTRYIVPMEVDGDGLSLAVERACIRDDGNWDYDKLDAVGMPWALRVESVPQMGPPQVMVDNAAQIEAALETFNANTPCAENGGGDEGGESGGSGGEAGESESGSEAGLDEVGGASSNCACSSGADDQPWALGLGLLGLAGLLRRRD